MSSFLITAPEALAAASADLTGIGSAIRAANAAAGATTTQVLPAAGDEVSAAIAALFGRYGQEFGSLNARAAAFHEQFVAALTSGAGMYAATEAASASPLQTLERDVLGVINAPTELLMGRVLIGDGTNGTPGTGQAGGPGQEFGSLNARAAAFHEQFVAALTS
ncbi:hypothetical protein A5641_12905, partial [Mycobacterium sp. 1554424.7]